MISARLIGIARLVLVIAACALWTAARSPALASTCTLADHIKSANTNTSVGNCPAGTSHDIITISEDIRLTELLPPITGTITIEGGGHSISGAGKFPIFWVKGGNLTINDLTLKRANSENIQQGLGGTAIDAQDSKLTVNKSSFVGNIGSAIVIWRSTVEINSSSFVANRDRYGSGGAIFVGQGVTLDVNIARSAATTREAEEARWLPEFRRIWELSPPE